MTNSCPSFPHSLFGQVIIIVSMTFAMSPAILNGNGRLTSDPPGASTRYLQIKCLTSTAFMLFVARLEKRLESTSKSVMPSLVSPFIFMLQPSATYSDCLFLLRVYAWLIISLLRCHHPLPLRPTSASPFPMPSTSAVIGGRQCACANSTGTAATCQSLSTKA